MGWTGGDEREEGHGGVRGEAEDEAAVGEEERPEEEERTCGQ